MALGIDGLVSSLPTGQLIDSLMDIEATPQKLLKNAASSTQRLLTELRALNTQIAALAENAKALPGKTGSLTGTSSAASATVSVGASAGVGTLSVRVDRVAQSQVSVTAAMSTFPEQPAVLTVRAADGTLTKITAASSSLADIAAAVNAADIGVTATRVAAGSGPGGEPLHRLQFASETTGDDAAFQVFIGDEAAVTAGTAPDLFAQPGAAHVSVARDAAVTLWAGTAAEQTVESSTNTFTSLLPGVDVTFSKPEPDPVVITVSGDPAATKKAAAGLMESLGGILATIKSKTAVSTTGTSAAGSIFTGDVTVRTIKDALVSAATSPVAGISPSSIGISITRDGTVDFDEEKFAKALAADPEGTEAALTAIAGRVETAASGISDRYEGTLTGRITGQQSRADDLTAQISDWDRRLASRRATLERTYAALEVQLSSLNAQSSWLSSQLATLPSFSRSSS
ncbi:flagellar hook-associated protein 2 [Diaminobutyricimonas aerilata]|uniref:Flagellar hook-associated protein 2 n=1 Tax=Diaminobutyricimonas aerilata TaxID=1162967 RepID=A0A2M9CN07_9MICO|nr:flagellar filament capping protein FliD [Diaminobutyricimonas aerilata]PJJ73296.1 flagellar hook-associated protein 2 [Diaminobutyricimonas aerilata]